MTPCGTSCADLQTVGSGTPALGIHERELARALLVAGVRRGLVSVQRGSGGRFPQNIWSVVERDDGEGERRCIPLEAQLENADQGTYHGYPLPQSDPLHEHVVHWWALEDE